MRIDIEREEILTSLQISHSASPRNNQNPYSIWSRRDKYLGKSLAVASGYTAYSAISAALGECDSDAILRITGYAALISGAINLLTGPTDEVINTLLSQEDENTDDCESIKAKAAFCLHLTLLFLPFIASGITDSLGVQNSSSNTTRSFTGMLIFIGYSFLLSLAFTIGMKGYEATRQCINGLRR